MTLEPTSIEKLYQVKKITISVERMTDEALCDNFNEKMDNIITLINSVLLNEAGAEAVLYSHKPNYKKEVACNR